MVINTKIFNYSYWQKFSNIYKYYFLFSFILLVAVETYFRGYDFYDLFPMYDSFRYFIWGNFVFLLYLGYYNFRNLDLIKNINLLSTIFILSGGFLVYALYDLSTRYEFMSAIFRISLFNDVIFDLALFMFGLLFCYWNLVYNK